MSGPKPLCFYGRPKPTCSAFLLTNFGLYVVAPVDEGDSRFRAVADWGAMVNVSTRVAIGASWFASVDEVGFMVGPTARFRRWSSTRSSLEVGVGTPLYSSDEQRSGSILGLVRWSPTSWLAVTARPETVRRPVYSTIGEYLGTRSRGRVSFGMEAGEVPGLVLTGAGGVAMLVLALLFIGYD